jgi:homoserine kinase
VGVGFDVLGVALRSIGDTVTVTRNEEAGRITISGVEGTDIPTAPERNTATAGILKLIADLDLRIGFDVKIIKGIPLGSGMGGSAASAVAGIVAANALLKKPLPKNDLLKYALVGESVATGTLHADNVAPCLLGGLTLIQEGENPSITQIPFPPQLVFVIALPSARLDTKVARAVLKPDVKLGDFARQSASLAGFIAGCFKKDVALIGSSFRDVVIEPQRAHLIAGFREVQSAALSAGALGCTISGAGPAVFALAKRAQAPKIKAAMTCAFEQAGSAPVRAWISAVNAKGAHLL